MGKSFIIALVFIIIPLFYEGEDKNDSHSVQRIVASIEDKNCISLIKNFFLEKRPLYENIKSATNKYFYEVYDTKGLRLFLKDVKDYLPEYKYVVFSSYTAPKDYKWYSNLLSRGVQFFPKKITTRFFGKAYEFRPIRGLTEVLIDYPLRIATKRIFKKEKEITLLLTVPIGFGTTWVAYDYADKLFNKELENKIDRQIEEHSEEWDQLIASEYSLSGIKSLLVDKKITPKEARKKAYYYVNLMNNYFKTMNEDYPHMDKDLRVMWALNHPLFTDIKKLAQEGVRTSEAYIYKDQFSPNLSTEQVEKLIDGMHALYITDNVISEMVRDDEAHKKSDATVNEVKSRITKDPFASYLFNLYKTKKINQSELVYRLQEDVFWQMRFKEWEIVHVSKRKKVDNQYTSESLTLDDIRQETVQELNSLIKK